MPLKEIILTGSIIMLSIHLSRFIYKELIKNQENYNSLIDCILSLTYFLILVFILTYKLEAPKELNSSVYNNHEIKALNEGTKAFVFRLKDAKQVKISIKYTLRNSSDFDKKIFEDAMFDLFQDQATQYYSNDIDQILKTFHYLEESLVLYNSKVVKFNLI